MKLVETSQLVEKGCLHPTVPSGLVCAQAFVRILRAKIGKKGRKNYQLTKIRACNFIRQFVGPLIC